MESSKISRFPARMSEWQIAGVFLLRPKNRDFLLGRRARPVGPVSGCGVFVSLVLVMVLGLGVAEDLYQKRLFSPRLDGDARSTDGTVTRLRMYRVTGSDRVEPVDYRVRFRYRPEDEAHEGRSLVAEASIPMGEFAVLFEGGPVRVVHLRSDPWSVRPWAVVEQSGSKPMSITGLLVFLVVSVFLTFAWVRQTRETSELAKGRLVHGRILASNLVKGEDASYLVLRYSLDLGERPWGIEGTTRVLRNDLEEDSIPPPGTPLVALWIPPGKHRVL